MQEVGQSNPNKFFNFTRSLLSERGKSDPFNIIPIVISKIIRLNSRYNINLDTK